MSQGHGAAHGQSNAHIALGIASCLTGHRTVKNRIQLLRANSLSVICDGNGGPILPDTLLRELLPDTLLRELLLPLYELRELPPPL